MVFEAHCMSFPCTELLLFNYAKVNTVFMAPLRVTKNYFSRGFFLKKNSLLLSKPFCLHLVLSFSFFR